MAETKINTLSTVEELRTTEPDMDGQVVLLRSITDRILHYVHKAGDKAPDDGTLVVVTASGKRWRLVRDGDTLQLAWFKTAVNSWDNAMDALLGFAATTGRNVAKIVFPRGTVQFKKPIILDYRKNWFLEGKVGTALPAAYSISIFLAVPAMVNTARFTVGESLSISAAHAAWPDGARHRHPHR